jgi:hypothetical protein
MFNIPLMVRIWRRRSADDISLSWLFGVWGCMVVMLPSALTSSDVVLRVFGVANVVLFSGVVVVVMYFRAGRRATAGER